MISRERMREVFEREMRDHRDLDEPRAIEPQVSRRERLETCMRQIRDLLRRRHVLPDATLENIARNVDCETILQPLGQYRHLFTLAARHHFDATIGHIFRPSGNAELIRLLFR